MNGINKDANIRLAINYIDDATKHLLAADDKQVEDALADLGDALWKLRSILNPS